jgi:superfamily II DNA or RNA helicase
VPAQSPRIPSPTELARIRRLPTSPQPLRGRRLAEAEKERALRTVRALVADRAADFAALDADEFSAALRCACQDGTVNAALIADAERRCAGGTAASRDLHQVLFTTPRAAGNGWERARGAAMAAAALRPHLAVEVVHLEIQRLGTPPLRVIESAAEGGFTARASLHRDGVAVEGQPCFDTSKKRAAQGAVVSLLAMLARVDVPVASGPTIPSGAGAGSSQASDRQSLAGATTSGGTPSVTPVLSPTDLEAWLDHLVSRPEPDPELAAQLDAGRLTVRSLYLLLFEARPRGWARHRAAAWEALVAAPSRAPGILSMHTQARSWPQAGYLERGERTAVAFVTTPDGPIVGEPGVATGIRAARASAALALVRDLAPPVAGGNAQAMPKPGGHPVALLNERAQVGAIAELTFAQEATGPAHRPVFTCTATCIHATALYADSAEAASKNEAKAAAAAGLLEQVLAAEQAHLSLLARARRDQVRSPEGIFARLLRSGLPVDFTGAHFRIRGELPDPLVGCALPLPSALPVLVALDGPTPDGHIDPSARAWASAAKVALEAVAARLVYPALDADGRDCWRIATADLTAAPDPAIAGFLDAVANWLLRPPGARLVIGDLPYAGRPRLLDPKAADWADRAADAAEAPAAARLVIRLSPPNGDGRPLRAHVSTNGADAARPPGGPAAGSTLLDRTHQRLLRAACREWLPLERVRRDGTLGGAEAAQLLGPVGDRLATLGIRVEWPADLVTASGLGSSGGLTSQLGVVSRALGDRGSVFPTGVADLTWQLSLNGDPLTDEETTAAADAVEGVLQLRGRWVVIDAQTRRIAGERHAGRLTGAQALGATLTGQVTVDGRQVACSGTGQLVDLVATLRAARCDPPTVFVAPDGLNATLRTYQRTAVHWLDRITAAGFGALLADDMGLGKTLTVIAYRLVRQDAGPSLVVCPASLAANWEREFARFAPGVAVRRYHALGRHLDGLVPGEVVVTTYGTLLRDADGLADVPWDLVVADEAQQVKNHRAQAAQALRRLPPRARVAVTGTPVENSLSELWAILDWTNPGLFGPLTAFRERFGRAAEREAVDAATDGDAALRLGRLIAPFVLRRRKTDPDIAPELPDKAINNRYVGLSREQAGLYQAATTQALHRITASSGLDRRGQVLRLLHSLRQICNSPAHYLHESPDGWDAPCQANRSGKLQALDELMEDIVLAEDAALIFTGYVSMGHLIRAHLAAHGIDADFLHGGVPIAARQEVVDRFQSGDGDALILSVRAAGTGLNLTRAGHVIHFDRPWNPAVEDQATDRAHRLGQHRLVEVHHLISEGTVEDRIAELLTRKRALTEAVLSSRETALTELSDGELAALVCLGTRPDEDGVVGCGLRAVKRGRARPARSPGLGGMGDAARGPRQRAARTARRRRGRTGRRDTRRQCRHHRGPAGRRGPAARYPGRGSAYRHSSATHRHPRGRPEATRPRLPARRNRLRGGSPRGDALRPRDHGRG